MLTRANTNAGMTERRETLPERRAGRRQAIDWPVMVVRSTGEILSCHAIDAGEEGLRLRSVHAFPPGALLRLKLCPSDQPECVLRGRVCYQVLESDAILTGVRFENISLESRLCLRQMLQTK